MLEPAIHGAFWLLLTLGIFSGSTLLYRRTGIVLLNPVLVTILALIIILYTSGTEYATYQLGGRWISVFLEPSVVALGVPLYLQREELARHGRALFGSILVGSTVGVMTAVGTAAALGGSESVLRALAPRSVTTPIAIGIAERIGGIPSLTAALVISSGVLGAVLGPAFLRAVGVRSRSAFGLALGAASHGIGTARAVQEGELEAASGGLAIGLMGVATAVLAPLLVGIFFWLFPH
jgi:predicted murein hydrolase (TIGR00659 family)